ncbi:MAG TPA: hypothetical protein VJ570_12660 [Holophagaceae bacterium]|nr:hypothetical protein [Holophagaceae bacterium]
MRPASSIVRSLLATLGALGLAVSVACGGGGGGSSPATASSLDYTAPSGVGPTEYQFVKNAASTNTHLILDLMGPATPTTGHGVSFELSASPSKITWVNGVNEGTTTSTFNLGAAPKLLKSRLAAANANLQAGLFQKVTVTPAATLDGTHALAQIALDLKAGATVGDAALAVVASKAFITNATGDPTPITVKVGSLQAK